MAGDGDAREEVKPVVRELIASCVDDVPFGWDDSAKVGQLATVVIDQVRLRRSNGHLGEFVIEEVIDVADGDTEITRVRNPVHLPCDRIKRTNVKVLNELGVLGNDGEDQSTGQPVTEFFAENES